MNSKSLDKELKNLKHYLKETKSLNETTDKNQKKIITYTLVGMIMSLYNLIKTGAYDEQNKSELFKITEEARNTAIHYGYFNDFNNTCRCCFDGFCIKDCRRRFCKVFYTSAEVGR